MRTVYLELKMGAAGDMLCAALYELLDAGNKEAFLRRMNRALSRGGRKNHDTSFAGRTGTL